MREDKTSVKEEEKKILIFNIAGGDLGLDISCVREVLRFREIHPLPKAPRFIEGVINLRGHIIAVIDLRKKFNIKVKETNPQTRIIICRIKEFISGLIVDSVSEVMNLPVENIDPAPEVISTQVEESYIAGIVRLGERIITILDLEKIFTPEDLGKIPNIKK